MFTGGMYPVIDMTAGEKERRTLEAFLASPAARQEIVLGKISGGHHRHLSHRHSHARQHGVFAQKRPA